MSVAPALHRNQVAALAAAQRGRAIFPCRADKRPLTRRGFKEASDAPAVVGAWWDDNPGALIGVPTGARNGVWVLDVDNHGGVPGEESLTDLCARHGVLPDTVIALTPSGGLHYYFRHPRGGVDIPNSAGRLGPGLDVRGDGGYVISPPSLLPDGRAYEWEGCSDPDEGVAIAPAPDWLLALVVKRPDADHGGAGDGVSGGVGAPIREGGRNAALFSIGRSLRAKGLSAAAIEAALLAENRARCLPPLDDEEVMRAAGSAASKPPGRSQGFSGAHSPPMQSAEPPMDADGPTDLKVVGGTDFDDRPSVRIVSGQLPQAVDAIEGYLIDSQADIFQHGTRLVRVGQWADDAPSDANEANTGAPAHTSRKAARPSGAGVLVDVSPEWLVDQSTRRIRFERYDKRRNAWANVDCPSKLATTMLARVGSWRFPALVGFCDSPTLDLAGRIVSAPGYDPPSGLYLCHPPALPPMGVIDRPAAERAAERLLEAVGTFPFVSQHDAAACVALMMTALLRRVLPAAPLGAISATAAGTGKSKLADVISAIATGRKAAVTAMGHTPEETEKRLDSVLLSGDVLANFDNVDRAVKSDVLCQVTTQEIKTIRILGLSKKAEAPTNIALLMTGNNLTLLGDLVRRCVVVTLDAGCERPELRQFDRDAVEYVLERRGALIAASLTISKAYIDDGCPAVDAAPYGSFEDWDRMIRRALIWAGLPDPLAAAETMRDQDHEVSGMAGLLAAWESVNQDAMTAADLRALIRESVANVGEGYSPSHPELQEYAVQVLGDMNRWDARDLGYRLRAMQGRLFDGRRLVKDRKAKRGVLWRVENVQG